MTELTIDRRRLLRWGLSTSALAAMPLGCPALQSDDTDRLLQVVSDADLPVDAEGTGVVGATATVRCTQRPAAR